MSVKVVPLQNYALPSSQKWSNIFCNISTSHLKSSKYLLVSRHIEMFAETIVLVETLPYRKIFVLMVKSNFTKRSNAIVSKNENGHAWFNYVVSRKGSGNHDILKFDFTVFYWMFYINYDENKAAEKHLYFFLILNFPKFIRGLTPKQ